jgi:hypothetical protein
VPDQWRTEAVLAQGVTHGLPRDTEAEAIVQIARTFGYGREMPTEDDLTRRWELPLIGNKKSLIYHTYTQANYGDVHPNNQVRFWTEQDAIDAGYRRAENDHYGMGSGVPMTVEEATRQLHEFEEKWRQGKTYTLHTRRGHEEEIIAGGTLHVRLYLRTRGDSDGKRYLMHAAKSLVACGMPCAASIISQRYSIGWSRNGSATPKGAAHLLLLACHSTGALNNTGGPAEAGGVCLCPCCSPRVPSLPPSPSPRRQFDGGVRNSPRRYVAPGAGRLSQDSPWSQLRVHITGGAILRQADVRCLALRSAPCDRERLTIDSTLGLWAADANGVSINAPSHHITWTASPSTM